MTRRARRPGVLAGTSLAFALLTAPAAIAGPVPTSGYTKFDLKPPACRSDPGPGEGFTCKGLGGWSVIIGYPAVGASITVARSNQDNARVAFPRDGRDLVIDGSSSSDAPVEWRGPSRGGRFDPNAAIIRVEVLDAAQRQETIEDGRPHGPARRTQVLVVYRLGPGSGVCRIAFVDARTNPRANELAREAADGPATCPVDSVAILGRSSPILDGAIR